MPIYEYCCKDCNHEMEVLQKMNALPLSICPACKLETLEQCISAPSIRLTGSGYYETDEKPKSKQRNILQCDNKEPNSAKCNKGCNNNSCEKTSTTSTT